MTVYHGTGFWALPGILSDGPILRRRPYHRPRKSFCTTTSFDVAELFAIRKTSADEILAGGITGIILEYRLNGCWFEDFEHVRDARTPQNEHEVAVYRAKALELLAVWRYAGAWTRQPEKNDGRRKSG